MSKQEWRTRLVGIGRKLVVLFVIVWFIVFIGMTIYGWDNLASSFRIEDSKSPVDCREFEVDLQMDKACELSDDCVFTRDEYSNFKAQEELYRRHCEASQ